MISLHAVCSLLLVLQTKLLAASVNAVLHYSHCVCGGTGREIASETKDQKRPFAMLLPQYSWTQFPRSSASRHFTENSDVSTPESHLLSSVTSAAHTF